MRAPELLFLRWFLTHLSRILVRLNLRLLEFTRTVLEDRRDHVLGGFLTAISIRLVALNSKLVAVTERLRRHWESDL